MKTFMILVSLVLASQTWAYTGFKNSEALVSFTHWVELSPESGHSKAAVRQAIQDQIDYVFGPLTYGNGIGAPRQNQEIPDETISLEKRADGIYVAHYNYTGTFVLRNGPQTHLKILLPNNPYTFWQNTVNQLAEGAKNPCTDPSYQGEGDYWYFWMPSRPGCNVLKEKRDYSVIDANIVLIPNMHKSFPEYEKLPNKNGDILVTFIVGKDTPSRIRSPYKTDKHRDDLNAINFRAIEKGLLDLGFQGRELSNDEIKQVVKEPLNPYPFVKEYMYNYQGNRARRMVIRLVYSTIDVAHQSNGFHYYFINGLEKSAIMIYDGHSGLGANLNLPIVRQSLLSDKPIRLDKEKYQILFFNGCSSYSYYNDDFFNRKIIKGSEDLKGSKFLDVITAGVESAFDTSVDTDMALLIAAHSWALDGSRQSYQELTQKMEANNILGVNGDEDNPTK